MKEPLWKQLYYVMIMWHPKPTDNDAADLRLHTFFSSHDAPDLLNV